MFNALRYTKELEKAGFSHEQAEASVTILIDAMNDNFATKSDIKELDSKIDSAVKELDSKIDSTVKELNSKIDSAVKELNSKIDSNALKFESSLREMEYKLTIKLGTMLTLAIGVTATIVHLIQH
jgi:hypothetical protein